MAKYTFRPLVFLIFSHFLLKRYLLRGSSKSGYSYFTKNVSYNLNNDAMRTDF